MGRRRRRVVALHGLVDALSKAAGFIDTRGL
jgi:hypothetical protein